MPTRPVIGITANVEEIAFGAWRTAGAFVPSAYADAVRRAGGLALVLPPDPAAQDDPHAWLDLLDGLLLSGGADLDPAAYGAERHPATVATNAARDRFELALTRAALDAQLPVLGICRGMQLLNVACGGTLHQEVAEVTGSQEHRRRTGTFDGNVHDVDLEPGSLAARVAGEERHAAASHHHQAVDAVGAGLRVSGRAADGVLEALEGDGPGWCLAVQWHPEADEASRIIGGLVAAASPAAGRAA